AVFQGFQSAIGDDASTCHRCANCLYEWLTPRLVAQRSSGRHMQDVDTRVFQRRRDGFNFALTTWRLVRQVIHFVEGKVEADRSVTHYFTHPLYDLQWEPQAICQ